MESQDREKFDQDLADLINSAAAIASSITGNSVQATPSPSAAPRLRKRSTPQGVANKRIRLDQNTTNRDARMHVKHVHVHPSRVGLVMAKSTTIAGATSVALRSPLETSGGAQRTCSDITPVSKTLKRKADDVSSAIELMARRDSAVSNGVPECGSLYTSVVDKSALSTLRHAVWRQWDSSKDGLPYEQLLDKRRTEHLGSKVDRYVPNPTSARIQARSGFNLSFPYTRLPEKIRAKVLKILLVNHEPIVINFNWLRSFVNGHCRVPNIDKTIRDGDRCSYTVPIEWIQLVKDVSTMQKDCVPFRPALEDRGNKTRKSKAPCRGLTTGVLTVSKAMHAQAASVFYGSNTFRFPWPTSAWMQLESFLATIGPVNVGMLRNITIHCPLWHRGTKEDFLEGAILDLTSPASRLGIVKPSSRDRLLSAIAGSVEALSMAGMLETLAIDLENGLTSERWAGSYSNNRRLIAMSEAEEHVSRKTEGVRLLKSLSGSLPLPPVLTIYHQKSGIGKHDLSEFRSRLAGVIREANKYGWKVDQRLKAGAW